MSQRRRAMPRALLALVVITGAVPLAASAEEGLGRLFFTPERRQQLDHQRQFNLQERREIPADPALTINGVVTRSTGKRTVWINGVAVEENDATASVNVAPSHRNPGRVVIRSGESAPASAKVGDTVHRDSGETTDLLQGGRINIRRQTPAR